jgi:hypothetical protein
MLGPSAGAHLHGSVAPWALWWSCALLAVAGTVGGIALVGPVRRRGPLLNSSSATEGHRRRFPFRGHTYLATAVGLRARVSRETPGRPLTGR